jgi:hypothetical protein
VISELFGTVSSTIITLAAFTTVLVAVWQVRAHLIAAEKSNPLPVTSVVFNEFRSREFRKQLFKVWNEAPPVAPEGGFQELPEEYRESAYEVAYFFEHLGALVAYDLVPEDLVVTSQQTLLSSRG